MTADRFRFRCRIRVRWAECDAQGIVFNGAYFSYLEVAMAAYYRNLGIALYDPEGRRHFDTATVKATLEYVSPARVDDVLDASTGVSSGLGTLASRLVRSSETADRVSWC